jgi:outer membrane protein assembly factor BamB
MIRSLILWPLLLLLAGCSAFTGKDNADPPAELVEFESELKIKKLWSRSLEGVDDAFLKIAPAISDGKLYIAEPSGEVLAFDALNGEKLWSVDLDLPISGGPGINNGYIAVGTQEAELILMNAEDGSEVWRKTLTSEVLSVPAISRGRVVCRTIDGRVAAFDIDTAETLWAYDRTVPVLTLRGDSSPQISENQVLVGFANGKLVALQLDDGVAAWEASIATPKGRTELERVVDIDAELKLVEGTVYASAFHGEVAAVSETSGVVLWRRELSSHAGLDADWRQLYITDDQDHVWSLDTTNGAALWQQKELHARKLSAPAMIDGYLVVGDYEGYLHWMSQYDGRMLARSRAGSDRIRVQPLVYDGIVYVLGEGGKLSALQVEPVEAEEP